MKLATADIMRIIDKHCIDTLGIPSIVLMENAALKVIKNLDLNSNKSYCILCGVGNNGGDGFAIARHLSLSGCKVKVFVLGDTEKMSKDCQINHDILHNIGGDINYIDKEENLNEFILSLKASELLIDSLFGTGLSRTVQDITSLCIDAVNEYAPYIISVDIPSGMQSDTGEILGNCINADKTISFQLYKKGFLTYGSENYTGEVVIEDIGIPEFVVDKFCKNQFILEKEMIEKSLIGRSKYSYKGDFGRVLVIAGSEGFTGSAYISTEAAVKSGAGLVTLGCFENIKDILSSKLVEAMTISLNNKESLKNIINKCDAIAIGPGMGNNKETFELVKEVIKTSNCPIVIDADGINVLEGNLEILKEKNNDIIITPHFGEMSRITGSSIEYIMKNRITAAKEFARKNGIIVLLKGYKTVITDGNAVIINPTGNSAMASGGMGDCLTGMIASFLAQGHTGIKAASIAAYIHGYCGDEIAKDKFCVNASDILNKVQESIYKIKS